MFELVPVVFGRKFDLGAEERNSRFYVWSRSLFDPKKLHHKTTVYVTLAFFKRFGVRLYGK